MPYNTLNHHHDDDLSSTTIKYIYNKVIHMIPFLVSWRVFVFVSWELNMAWYLSFTTQNHTLCAHNIYLLILHYTPKALYHAIHYYFPCSPEHPSIGRYVDSLRNEELLVSSFGCRRRHLYMFVCHVMFVLFCFTFILFLYKVLQLH